MEAKAYQKAVEDWNKWWDDYSRYSEARRRLIEEDASERELNELEKHRPSLFGPFTFIPDPADLLNPSFILPGMDSSFRDLTNTDHNIPEYFGKRLYSELEKVEGIVIGYGYDAGDDYIRILTDSGDMHDIIVNSHYQVF